MWLNRYRRHWSSSARTPLMADRAVTASRLRQGSEPRNTVMLEVGSSRRRDRIAFGWPRPNVPASFNAAVFAFSFSVTMTTAPVAALTRPAESTNVGRTFPNLLSLAIVSSVADRSSSRSGIVPLSRLCQRWLLNYQLLHMKLRKLLQSSFQM